MSQSMGASAEPETWRAPLGYRGQYEVSSLGRVRREGRILKPIVDRYGYETYNLWLDGKMHREKVHRLVCNLFQGPPPTATHEVAHTDGNPRNNRADNLRWATRSENVQDAIAHGTHSYKPSRVRRPGETNHRAKFTNAQAEEMRLMHKAGKSERQLADFFGCARGTAHRIVSGKAYNG